LDSQTSFLDANLEALVFANFERQQVMQLLNARLIKVCPGEVHIEFPYHKVFTQQNGYIHAGILTTLVDSACGYAAYTLMPSNTGVLSIEFKVNFLSPAIGEKFIGIGKVIKAGRTITVCSGEVRAVENGAEKLVAVMQATMMTVVKRND
jgi:uncharacterized protein (TIGR00369 family)